MQSIQPVENGNALLPVLESLAPDAVPGWALVLTCAFVGVGVALGLVALIALVSTWLERKVSGHIQCRYGPMRVGWHGWLQPIADGVKLLMKEDMVPLGADRPLFLLAPGLVLASLFAGIVALPFAPTVYFADIDLGVFFIIAMLSMSTIGVVMAGWASNSKWSLYGAMREAAQVVAYEIPLGISLLVPLMVVGTFNLIEASATQAGWMGMKWTILQNPFVLPASILFFIAALAETKRAPFDLPEAESELVAGFMTEYSGLRWSFFFMEEYAAMFLMSIVGAIFFFGGFESPITALAKSSFGEYSALHLLAAHVTLFTKGGIGVLLMMWVRWTLPRVRIDQVMTMGYKYLTPLALLCVLGAGIWEAIVTSL
jgi:NADH-quinone oxidoreductase subunit H